ncbi:peroxidase 27 [Beta vulgaris subsp. vulgaris]|uniref:peroxidase 27 n=1 Tax=Beta vulgaris subsp. vulgaris TaxID=3555 RepID=UPI0020366A7A|nr:peroxidase 27 [Beta vulgaris subsp. vulgaris]
MTPQKFLPLFLIFAMLVAMANANAYANANALKLDFYKKSCPNAEGIVHRITEQYVKHVPNFAAGLLRMAFHDCAVRGCDASLLINPTAANNQTEKTAIPNSTLRGFEIIDNIKSALERECPGVVSCADILALASRDAVTTISGPWWEVPTGRRDGKVSLASEANALIPSPFADIATLKQNFAALGLTTKDLVVLSGSHTIGIGHCFVIQSRLYNFTGNGDTDPSISPSYAAWLKTRCRPSSNDFTSFVFMDRITPKVFDEKYYTMVTQNRGLFQSDAALLNDKETRDYLEFQVKTMGSTFPKDFAESMTKMIQIGVLTGIQGEIRKNCGVVNY